MSNVILTLGGVPFQDMEVPEKITFGGKQRVAVQNLIGGGRVVEVLGLDDGEISFSGIFFGADAASRVQMLDAARALGTALPLVWDSFFYTVIISDFKAEYRKSNLIPFSIVCIVVSDPVASLAAAAGSVVGLVASDIAAAVGMSGLAGVSVAGLSGGGLAGYSAMQNELTSVISDSGAGLIGTTSRLNTTGDVSSGVAALSQINSSSAQLAAAMNMVGYVNRAAVNVASELL
jgi:hypothetical protein